MTRIDFYFNVPNKQQLVQSLIEAALLKRRQVTIFTTDESAALSLSEYLWKNKAESFLPNTHANHAHAARSPVVIGLQADSFMHDDMLINLAPNEPSIFSRFTHLVELVSEDEADKVAARARYKFYRDRGYEIKNINHAQT
jgi:DNA polymerase III subunit chi